ncbi:MAG: glycosyltransferase family 2 protein [Candidatus Auribacterota bacterium]|jgi:glycosyltransferase involved in cell wall biosynthesis|nr:glycosyltransferase family 2 protein [Candidatus Auribacterota bacterium]
MSNSGEKISYYVLVPAYNVEKYLRDLIKRIKLHTHNILVIEDGSKDNTLKIIKEMNIEHIAHPVNKGKGASLNDGFAYLAEKNIDYVLTMDSDGQHAPEDIPNFIAGALKSRADIILGNRMDNPTGMPIIRYLTNRFTSWIITRMCGQKISDSQCGFRLISKKVLKSVAVESNNYDAESEIIIKAARVGYRISEVQVRTIYGLEKSTISPFRDTIRFFRLIYRLSRKKPAKLNIKKDNVL